MVGTVPPSLILSGSLPHTSLTLSSSALKYGESREVSHHDAWCVMVMWNALGDWRESNVEWVNDFRDDEIVFMSYTVSTSQDKG